MGKPMDYGTSALSYAAHRWALSWKLQPLLDEIASLVDRSAVLDIGCGTGDYLQALHEAAPHHCYRGVDISPEMLDQARSRCPWATLDLANAEVRLPAESHEFNLVYVVDVLHHLQDYTSFFAESARVLRNDGRLILVTDSEEDIRTRSLAEFFPATVPVNLGRYPTIESLSGFASNCGLHFVSRRTVRGYIDLDDRFMSALASKAISELRLIPDSEHERGMERAEASRVLRGKWLSQTTVIQWTRSGPRTP